MSDSNIQRKKAAYIPTPEGGGFTPSAIKMIQEMSLGVLVIIYIAP